MGKKPLPRVLIGAVSLHTRRFRGVRPLETLLLWVRARRTLSTARRATFLHCPYYNLVLSDISWFRDSSTPTPPTKAGTEHDSMTSEQIQLSSDETSNAYHSTLSAMSREQRRAKEYPKPPLLRADALEVQTFLRDVFLVNKPTLGPIEAESK